MLQLFCRHSAFRQVLSAEKRSYDFVPLMNALDPIALTLAMDLFGLLGSLSDFTISEGITFVCKELKQPSTPGTLMKALETLSMCAVNRHYLAYFPDTIHDVCKLIAPSAHMSNNAVDTVFALEKCLITLPYLIAMPSMTEELIRSGVVGGLLEIVSWGDSIRRKQALLPVCRRKTQHLELSLLALKSLLSLCRQKSCRPALLDGGAPQVLMELLDGTALKIFSRSELPNSLTRETAASLFSSCLPPEPIVALEILHVLCLSPFDAASLFTQHPSACSVVLAMWGFDALTSRTSSTTLPDRRSPSMIGSDGSRYSTTVIMRCGVGNSASQSNSAGKQDYSGIISKSLLYEPDMVCVPSLSMLPWLSLINSLQLRMLLDIIQYGNSTEMSLSLPQPTPPKSSRTSFEGGAGAGVGTGTVASMDPASVHNAKVIACAALHAIILSACSSEEPSSALIKQGVVALCADFGLLHSLEMLAPLSAEAAFLLSEIFAWEGVGVQLCSESFSNTLLVLLGSTSAVLRRVALKIAFDAVQHNGPSRAMIRSALPRRTVFAVSQQCISGCLTQLRVRSVSTVSNPPSSSSSSSGEAGLTRTSALSSEMEAQISLLPVERIMQLLVESLIVTCCYFDSAPNKSNGKHVNGEHSKDSQPRAAVTLSSDESQALTVACEGLVEILEVNHPNSSSRALVLSPIGKDLWTALLSLSLVKECTLMLLNTKLLSFIQHCLSKCSATTTAAEAMDRVSSRLSLDSGHIQDGEFITTSGLKVVATVINHFPDKVVEKLSKDDYYPLLFKILKTCGEDSEGTSASTHRTSSNKSTRRSTTENQIMAIFCSSSHTSIAVCEHLIVMNGFVAWLISSATQLCRLISAKGLTRSSSPGEWGSSSSNSTGREGAGEEDGSASTEGSRGLSVTDSLQQRLTLLANLCRCPNGKSLVFAEGDFLDQLSNFIAKFGDSKADGFHVHSSVAFGALSMFLALAPLFHSPALYPNSRSDANGSSSTAKGGNSRLTVQLVATLEVSADSRDLAVIDKVINEHTVEHFFFP